MSLKLKTPAEIKTGRLVSEVRMAERLIIQSVSFDVRLKRAEIKVTIETKESRVLETRQLSVSIESFKPQMKNFLRLIYGEIKKVPGFDGDIEVRDEP